MFDLQTEAFLRHSHTPRGRRAMRDGDEPCPAPTFPVLGVLSLALWCGVLIAAL